jgi:cyclase
MDIDVLVPGHGPIGGKAELAAMRDYLVLLRAAARTQFDRGVSAGIAAATIDLGPFARLPEADRVVDNVVRLYADFSGTMTAGRDVAAIARARRDYELARAGKP